MTAPFVSFGGFIIDTTEQRKRLWRLKQQKIKESVEAKENKPSQIKPTSSEKKRFNTKSDVSLCIHLSSEQYALLMAYKTRWEYTSTNALITRCIESYLNRAKIEGRL